MRLRRTVATTTLSDGVPSVTASGNQNRTKTSAHDKRRHVSTLPGAELVTPPNQVSSQTRIRTRSRTSPPPISTAPPTNAKRPKTTRIRISLNKGGVSNINQTTKDATANGQAAEKEERNIPPHLPKDNVPPKSREAMPKFQASSFAHDEDLNNAALAIYNSQSSDFNFDLQLLDLDLDETPLKYQTKTEDKEKHPGGSTTRVGYHQTEQQPSGNFGTFSQYERQVFTENTSYNPVPNQRGQSQFQHGHNPPQTFHHQPPLAWEAQASASLAKTTFGKGGSWYPGAQHYSRRPSVEDFSKLNNFQDTSALVSPRTAFSTMEETVSTNEVESEGTIKMKLFKADNVAESPIETTNKSLASPVDTATSKTISGKLETVSSYHFFVEKMSEPCDIYHETSMADFSPMETRSVTHRHNLVKFNQTTSCIPHPVMPQQNQKSQQISQYPTGSYSHAVAPVYHMAPHNYGQQQQQHHQLLFSASSAARVLPFGVSHFPIVNAPAATMNTNNKKGSNDAATNLYLDWNAKGPGSGPVTF